MYEDISIVVFIVLVVVMRDLGDSVLLLSPWFRWLKIKSDVVGGLLRVRFCIRGLINLLDHWISILVQFFSLLEYSRPLSVSWLLLPLILSCTIGLFYSIPLLFQFLNLVFNRGIESLELHSDFLLVALFRGVWLGAFFFILTFDDHLNNPSLFSDGPLWNHVSIMRVHGL